jgi:hypothetical protein
MAIPALAVLLFNSSLSLNTEAPTETQSTALAERASTLLPALTIAEPTFHDYNRDEWQPNGWANLDHDCLDTRAEVLFSESVGPGLVFNNKTCKVLAGNWNDEFTGQTFTSPKEVQIDHLVSLADANRSGGWAWPSDKKIEFSNDLSDPDHLNAMKSSENQAKSDKGPDEWMPPNDAARCRYVQAYARIKARWQLSVTKNQWRALQAGMEGCG